MEHQLFQLAHKWGWSPDDIRALPWARRQRAMKWISFISDYEATAARATAGSKPVFDHEGLLDVVWRAPPDTNFGV